MVSLYDIDAATGCWIWRGARHSDGSPWEAGRSAGVVQWETWYGAVPRQSRAVALRRLCGERQCVAPCHRVLRWPEAFWERLGRSTAELSAAALFLRKLGESALGLCWTPPGWALPPDRVAWLASRLQDGGRGADRLTILTAYAVVVRDALDRPDPNARENALAVVKAAQRAVIEAGAMPPEGLE